MSRRQTISDFAQGVQIIFDYEDQDAAVATLVEQGNLKWFAVVGLTLIYSKTNASGGGQVIVNLNRQLSNGSSNNALRYERAFTTTELTTPTASLDPTAATFQQPFGNEQRATVNGAYDGLSQDLFSWNSPLIVPPSYWLKVGRYTSMTAFRYEATLLSSATWPELAGVLRSPHGALRKPPGMGI